MNLTQTKRAGNLRHWKSTPPGLIERPLRFIRRQRIDRALGSYSAYPAALAAVKRGDGLTVQRLARGLVREVKL